MSPPVSWMRLERYHLGEVDGAERRRIESVLSSCTETRARLDQIQADARPMPALPVVVPRRVPWRWPAALAAAAAAVVLLVLRPPGGNVKGDTIAISLVRERAGRVTVSPRSYTDGDRISVRVSCPPGDAIVEIDVYQQDEHATPIPPQQLTCGNATDVSGAFRVTGPGEVEVCATIGEQTVCTVLPEGA